MSVIVDHSVVSFITRAAICFSAHTKFKRPSTSFPNYRSWNSERSHCRVHLHWCSLCYRHCYQIWKFWYNILDDFDSFKKRNDFRVALQICLRFLPRLYKLLGTINRPFPIGFIIYEVDVLKLFQRCFSPSPSNDTEVVDLFGSGTRCGSRRQAKTIHWFAPKFCVVLNNIKRPGLWKLSLLCFIVSPML